MDEEILFDFRRSMENLEEVFQPARTKHGQNTDRRMRVGFDLLNLLEVVHYVQPMVDDQACGTLRPRHKSRQRGDP